MISRQSVRQHEFLTGKITHLLDAIQKSIGNIPSRPIINRKPPRQPRLVQVNQQPDSQIPQLNVLKVKARAWRVKESRYPRQQKSQVTKARDAGDEWCRRRGGVRDV